jgi:hypothetical protein
MKLIISIWVLIVFIGFIGWVKNLVKLSDCNFEAPYNCEIIHSVGLIPPVGAITGWLTIDDNQTE